MNKFFHLIVLAAVCGLSPLAADEKTAAMEHIYRNAVNDEMRMGAVLNIRALHDSQFGPLLTEALADVVARRITLGTLLEVDLKVRLTTELIQELGDLNETPAARLIAQVYREVSELPLLRAEAAMALGKLRATEYVPMLAEDLAYLNLQPDRDHAAAQETEAYALVQALASMGDSRAYEPVFFASIGWYGPQRKVKETARASLRVLSSDPTPQLLKLLPLQPGPVAQREILKAESESTAPDAGKAQVALAVLMNGVSTVPANIVETVQWGDVRKDALKVLAQIKDKSTAAALLFRQQYRTAALARDTSELLSVIQSLGLNGSPEALSYLTELLSGFNVRAGTPGLLTDFDIQQIRAVLQAFKTADDPAARPVLLQSQTVDYTPALKRDIKAVLDGLRQ